jgi:hypothetical protein
LRFLIYQVGRPHEHDRFEEAKDLAAAEGRSAEFIGDMAGGALFEVGSILVPVGLVAKAGKLGKVASVADGIVDATKTVKKIENAEDVLGATQKAKAASANPAIKELDEKVSPVQKCPVADCDKVGKKNADEITRGTLGPNAGSGQALEVLPGGNGKSIAGYAEYRLGSGDAVIPNGTT